MRNIEYCYRYENGDEYSEIPQYGEEEFEDNFTDEMIMEELGASNSPDYDDDFVFWIKDLDTGKTIFKDANGVDEEMWIKDSITMYEMDPYMFVEAGFDYDFLWDRIKELEEEDDWEDDVEWDDEDEE